MERKAYLALRRKLYKLAGEVGALAETDGRENSLISAAYKRISHALDAVEVMGEELGYIDIDTGNVIDRRLKSNSVAQLLQDGHFSPAGSK